jgi:PBP1b-binding outer membrane lipoprotein LpoB
MTKTKRLLSVYFCAIALTSCATTITGSTDSTVAPASTTTILVIPTGSIISLLQQLIPVADGLGQAIVDGNSKVYKAKVAEADAILLAVEPLIRDSKIDVLESVQRVVRLIHSAAESKRPADADKALRFIPLIIDAVTPLLNL